MRELDNFGISRSQELQHTLDNENYKKKIQICIIVFFWSKLDVNVYDWYQCQSLRLTITGKFRTKMVYMWEKLGGKNYTVKTFDVDKLL